MKHRVVRLVAGLLLGATGAAAEAKPPLAAFGAQPTIRAMQLSHDGARIAYIQSDKSGEFLMLLELASGKRTKLIDASNIKARGMRFVGEDYLLLYGSKSLRPESGPDRAEMSGAFSVNLRTAKAQQLMPPDEINLTQSGIGEILAVTPDGKSIVSNAFVVSVARGPLDISVDISFDLVKINLETGQTVGGGVKGANGTNGWFATPNGQPLARIDQSYLSGKTQIISYAPKSHAIYSTYDRLAEMSLVGLKAGDKSIYIVQRAPGEQFASLYEMALEDGKITGPVIKGEGGDIEEVYADQNSHVLGVSLSGFVPRYRFFDDKLSADIGVVQKSFPGEVARLTSWTTDWSKLVFLVEGGRFPSRYVMVDRSKGQMSVLAQMRPQIAEADVGPVSMISYSARDKQRIPALVTFPAGVAEADRKNLPLIVLPHGGPESYDRVEFDWLAQYFANEGYMVLQPQFRGSDGFGLDFRDAGHKQWGRRMQDDITDGLKAMVAQGWADPNRVCIVGWSYGGYASLAGGAQTPELYKCVVAIAGVSNLPEMLFWEKDNSGNKGSSFLYWKSRIGDPDSDSEQIKAVSPALHADKFTAPVLLVHGQTDSTVPPEQSDMMNTALQKAGKQVKLVKIPGDDHSLVFSESRIAALTAIGEFLKANLK